MRATHQKRKSLATPENLSIMTSYQKDQDISFKKINFRPGIQGG
jgi:hypothetical protein